MSKTTAHILSTLIPAAKKVQTVEGELVITGIRADYAPFAEFSETFCTCANKLFDRNVVSAGNGNVVLTCNPDLPKGKYVVDTMGENAVLSACDSEGICYAIATLVAMLNLDGDTLQVQKAIVEVGI